MKIALDKLVLDGQTDRQRDTLSSCWSQKGKVLEKKIDNQTNIEKMTIKIF